MKALRLLAAAALCLGLTLLATSRIAMADDFGDCIASCGDPPGGSCDDDCYDAGMEQCSCVQSCLDAWGIIYSGDCDAIVSGNCCLLD